jgi:hypothetical protein
MRRKFAQSFVTSVRCERKIVELADSMDIPLADALIKGVLYTAEFKLEHEPAKYSSATHDLFLALQKKNLDELPEWLGIQKIHQKRITEFAKMAAEKERPAPLIWVWDDVIEQTIQIREDAFNPEYQHKKQVQA